MLKLFKNLSFYYLGPGPDQSHTQIQGAHLEKKFTRLPSMYIIIFKNFLKTYLSIINFNTFVDDFL